MPASPMHRKKRYNLDFDCSLFKIILDEIYPILECALNTHCYVIARYLVSRMCPTITNHACQKEIQRTRRSENP
jgi:hypothetical protein